MKLIQNEREGLYECVLWAEFRDYVEKLTFWCFLTLFALSLCGDEMLIDGAVVRKVKSCEFDLQS